MAVNLREYEVGDSYGLQSRKYPPRARKRNRFYDEEEFDLPLQERDQKQGFRGGRRSRSPSESPPPSPPQSYGRNRRSAPQHSPPMMSHRREASPSSPPHSGMRRGMMPRRRQASPGGFMIERSPSPPPYMRVSTRDNDSPVALRTARPSSPALMRIRKSGKPSRMGYNWSSGMMPIPPSTERRIGQMNATRLRNMLKLPKAHRWVFYEWFYSNLDRPIFLGESDFRMCLRDNFPQLKSRRLTRTHWSLLRKHIGKPRRCSAAFFAEERRALHEKRDKIRKLQMKSAVEPDFVRDLGDDMLIPMPLIIGTRVTARVRYPTDGLYTGMVDAIDSYNHSYRITFDKVGLGTRTIPDYEVLSIMPQETIPISAYKTQHKASRNLFMSPARLLAMSAVQGVRQHMAHAKMAGLEGVSAADCPICQAEGTPGKGGSTASEMSAAFSTTGSISGDSVSEISVLTTVPMTTTVSGQPLILNDTDTYGGYPMKFLVMITKMSKILEVKKRCLEDLAELHTEAERKVSTQDPLTLEFQQNYATVILHLERVNSEMEQYNDQVLQYAKEISQEHGLAPLDSAAEIRVRCDERAQDLVSVQSSTQKIRVRRRENLRLVSKLMSPLMQLRMLADVKASPVELSSVLNAMKEIKAGLHPSNVKTFESNVEIHVNHLMSGLNEEDGLALFKYTTTNSYL